MGAIGEQASNFRVKVDVYCPSRQQHRTHSTSGISMTGVFIVGIPCLMMGAEVEVSFGKRSAGALTLPCVVDMVTLDGVHLKYNNPGAVKLLALHEVLWPEWDRNDLLKGVLILSRSHKADNLADWMRLTALASQIGRHITLARIQFRNQALPNNAVPRAAGKPHRAHTNLPIGSIPAHAA